MQKMVICKAAQRHIDISSLKEECKIIYRVKSKTSLKQLPWLPPFWKQCLLLSNPPGGRK